MKQVLTQLFDSMPPVEVELRKTKAMLAAEAAADAAAHATAGAGTTAAAGTAATAAAAAALEVLAPASQKKQADTTSDDSDMPIAASSGVTKPSAAAGIAIAL